MNNADPNIVTEVRKERGVRFVLREGGLGADRVLDEITSDLADLQLARMQFEESLLFHFDRVSTPVSIGLTVLWIVFTFLSVFPVLRFAIGWAVNTSAAISLYVFYVQKKHRKREASIHERLHVLQQTVLIVRSIPREEESRES